MKKEILEQKTQEVINNTKEALQTLFDNINKGQRKQLVKKEIIKELFDRYGVDY